MPGLRKTALIFIYISLFVLIIGVMMRLLHGYYYISRQITLLSYFGLLAATAAYIAAAPKANKNILTPAVYRLSRASKLTGVSAIACVALGLLMKIFNCPAGGYPLFTGLALLLVYLAISFRLVSTRKKLLNIATIELLPGELEQYVGTYHNDQLKMDIVVSKNDTQTSLVAQATKQSPFPLYAIAKDVFNYDRAGIVMEFKPGSNLFILIQRGGYFPFTRV